jgi:hypothetical protein
MGGEDVHFLCSGRCQPKSKASGFESKSAMLSAKDISMFFFLFFLSRYRDTRVIGVFYKAKMHYSRRKNSDLICMKCYDDFRPSFKTTTPLSQNIQREEHPVRERERNRGSKSPRYPKPETPSAVRFVVKKEKKRESGPSINS